jgi:hypothetical protein
MPQLFNELGELFRTISDVLNQGSASPGDWLAMVLLGVLTLVGFLKGLSGIIIPLAALSLGLKLATDPSALSIATGYTGITSPMALACMVLAAVLLAGMLTRTIVKAFFQALIFLWIADRLSGAVMGLVTACCLASVAGEYIQAYIPDSFRHSGAGSPVVDAAERFNKSMPFSGVLSSFVNDTANAAKPLVDQVPEGLKELPNLGSTKW